jgi:hypothetical protein
MIRYQYNPNMGSMTTDTRTDNRFCDDELNDNDSPFVDPGKSLGSLLPSTYNTYGGMVDPDVYASLPGVTSNQALVGKQNPRTFIPPVMVPPIVDMSYWHD